MKIIPPNNGNSIIVDSGALGLQYGTIASASTIDLSTKNSWRVTGTTSITNISDPGVDSLVVDLVFDDILTLTHGNLIRLPRAQDIVTAANDTAKMVFIGGYWYCASYRRYSGLSNCSSGTLRAGSAGSEYVKNANGASFSVTPSSACIDMQSYRTRTTETCTSTGPSYIGGGAYNRTTSSSTAVFGGKANFSTSTSQAVFGGVGNKIIGSSSSVLGNYSVGGSSSISFGSFNITVSSNNTVAGNMNFSYGSSLVFGVGNFMQGSMYLSVGGYNNGINSSAQSQFIGFQGADCYLTNQTADKNKSKYAIVMGRNALVLNAAGMYFGSPASTSLGQSQYVEYIAVAQTTNNTIKEMTISASSPTNQQYIEFVNNEAYQCRLSVSAMQTNSAYHHASWEDIHFLVKNTDGVLTIDGSGLTAIAPTRNHASASSWLLDVDVTTSPNRLRLRVTGETSKNINWTARLEMTGGAADRGLDYPLFYLSTDGNGYCFDIKNNDLVLVTGFVSNTSTSYSYNLQDYSNNQTRKFVSQPAYQPGTILIVEMLEDHNGKFKEARRLPIKLTDEMLALHSNTSYGPNCSITSDGTYLYIAAVAFSAPYLSVMKYNLSTGETSNALTATPDSYAAYQCKFSCDGSLLLVGGTSSNQLTVYSRTGTTYDTKGTISGTKPGSAVSDIVWHPSNTYVAVGMQSSPYLYLYSVSGTTVTYIGAPSTTPTGTVNSMAWRSDGAELLTAHSTSPNMSVYTHAAGVLTKRTNPATLPAGTGYACSYSPDESYILIGHSSAPFLNIYDTATLTKQSQPATNDVTQTAVRMLTWPTALEK